MFQHSTLPVKLGLLASIVGFAFAAAPAQATTVNLPAGSTATVTGAFLDGCNSLSYGYNFDGVDHGLGYSWGGCYGQYQGTAVIGPYSAAHTLRFYLRDNNCGYTFYSDGNHASWSYGSNPY